MELQEKAERIANTFDNSRFNSVACIENEYNSLREQLFNLRSCGVIVNEQTYLVRLQTLIDEEALLIQMVRNLITEQPL